MCRPKLFKVKQSLNEFADVLQQGRTVLRVLYSLDLISALRNMGLLEVFAIDSTDANVAKIG